MPSAAKRKPSAKRKPKHETAAVWFPVGELKAWPDNPRVNDGRPVSELVRNIKRYGFTAPLLAREATREVIAGHTRLKAALELRMPTVPVRFIDCTADEAHRIALADNRLAELATWDDEALRTILRDLDSEGHDLDDLGWTDDELEELMAGGVALDSTGDDDAPDVQQGPADSKLGGVYELGPHRLVCGDCREPATLAMLMGDTRINVAFTSPPYASQRKYDESSGFKPIPPDEYVDWFEAVQANVRAHLADDGSWFVNIKAHCEDGQRHLYVNDLVAAHVRRWGWRFVDEFCWERTGLPGRYYGRFKNAFEPVYHFSLMRPSEIRFRPDAVSNASDSVPVYHLSTNLNPVGSLTGVPATRSQARQRSAKRKTQSGLALPSNRLPPFQTDGSEHTAAFPVGLPDFFARAYSDEGDTVCDPFAGSGTTLIACAKLGRIAHLIELSPHYCDVIRRRWTRWATENGQDVGSGGL